MDPLRPLYLQKLDLCQFRNYTELSIAFSPAINCLTGPNGSGKTNVLDAIHYLAFTRGFRSSQDPQAVQEETSFFLSKAEVMRDGVSRTVECNFVKGKGKKILVNQKPVERLSEHIGQIPLVTVLPQDTDLINGPAEDRRRFLDMIISQYDPAYLRELIRYERALTQRNALIRSFLRAHTWDSEQLELWAGQMLAPAVAIRAGRERFLEEFMPLFESFFHRIVSESETPALAYLSQTTENTPDAWYRQILSANDKDRALGYTSSGTHRDDLQFRINGRTVRHYGSQGQQKTFVIALKLAQYTLLGERSGTAPLLLLDDIFDKLDEKRLQRIARILETDVSGQIFLTDTSRERMEALFAEAGRDARFFNVMAGQIQS